MKLLFDIEQKYNVLNPEFFGQMGTVIATKGNGVLCYFNQNMEIIPEDSFEVLDKDNPDDMAKKDPNAYYADYSTGDKELFIRPKKCK